MILTHPDTSPNHLHCRFHEFLQPLFITQVQADGFAQSWRTVWKVKKIRLHYRLHYQPAALSSKSPRRQLSFGDNPPFTYDWVTLSLSIPKVKNRNTNHVDSHWEVLGMAGSDALPLVDLLQDFLRERGLRSEAVNASVVVSLGVTSAWAASWSSGRFSSKRATTAAGDEVRGDFGGGSGLWVLSNCLLVPCETSSAVP